MLKPKFFVRSLLLVGLVISATTTNAQSKKNSDVRVEVAMKDSLTTGQLKIAVYEDGISMENVPNRIDSALKMLDGSDVFTFKNVKKPFYISLYRYSDQSKRRYDFLKWYLIEPADTVKVVILRRSNIIDMNDEFMEYQISFLGKSKKKFQCKFEGDSILRFVKNPKVAIDKNGRLDADNYYNVCRSKVKRWLATYKKSISKSAYDIMKTDFLSIVEIERIGQLLWDRNLQDSNIRESVAKQYDKIYLETERELTDLGRINSAWYPRFLLDRYSIGKYKGGNSKRLKDQYVLAVFDKMAYSLKGEVRDRIVAFFAASLYKTKFGEQIMTRSLQKIETDGYLEVLTKITEKEFVGKKPYNFSLPDTSNKMISLENFKGKVVFVDFWYTGCGGCAQYYTGIVSKAEEHFKKNPDVLFLTISIDEGREKWLNAIKSGIYTSSDNINLFTEGKGAEHSVIQNYRVRSYPNPLLIGKDGLIFSNNTDELRAGRSEGLIKVIDKAILNTK